MTQGTSESGNLGTFTVLDILLFVAASSVSALLIREQLPEVPTTEDYLILTSYCGPAGLSVFGPWAVRRQFMDNHREFLQPGEWLWIGLGGAWLAAAPLIAVLKGTGVNYFTSLIAAVAFVPAIVASIQSLPGASRRPWTHWAGIGLCLLHASPAFLGFAPQLWRFADRVINGFIAIWYWIL